jgi:hypothetical protein
MELILSCMVQYIQKISCFHAQSEDFWYGQLFHMIIKHDSQYIDLSLPEYLRKEKVMVFSSYRKCMILQPCHSSYIDLNGREFILHLLFNFITNLIRLRANWFIPVYCLEPSCC